MNTNAQQLKYCINKTVTAQAFIDLLKATSLGERRPIEDKKCMQGMLDNANLTITAWSGQQLIGIARCVCDFHYACYLSDLAVHQDYQNLGVGKHLQSLILKQLEPTCKLILLAAPAANAYYEKLGFTNNPRCWVITAGSDLS